MTEQVSLAVGSIVSISESMPASYDAAGFNRLSYTPIKGLRDAGDIAEQHATSTRSLIGLDYSYQERAGEILPTLTWEVVRLKGNEGQQLLFDAFRKPAHSFQITHEDGTELYFTATVKSRRRINLNGSSVLAYRFELDLQCRVVEV